MYFHLILDSLTKIIIDCLLCFLENYVIIISFREIGVKLQKVYDISHTVM